jgi:ribose transport system substrate-binding protein
MLRTTLFVSLALAAMLCAGCRTHVARRVINAIPSDSAETDFVCEHAGLAEAAARYSLEIYWNGPSGSADSELQIKLVDNAIRRKDLGVVLTPTASLALGTVVQRSLSAGIPVVILDSSISLPPNAGLFFVLDDLEHSEGLGAERVHKILGDKGEVAIIGIDPRLPRSIERAKLFESKLAAIAPQVHIVAQSVGTVTFGQAEMTSSQILRLHPNLGAIYAMNPPSTSGAVAALHNAHLTHPVSIVGHDQTGELLVMLRHGAIDSLLIRDMQGMAHRAVENIVSSRAGRPLTSVTYFQSALLSRENIDTEPMQQMLRMDWRPRP